MRPYYEQDGIAIYHGDCREIIPALGLRPDVTIADPPYAETSLEWDRWPVGWPTMNGLGRSLWCFGSLRMFVARSDEFTAGNWLMSQDLVWEKHNGSGFAADRFKRVHEQAAHFYRGAWGDIYHSPPRVRRMGARKTVRTRGQTPHTGEIGNIGYTDDGERLMRSVIYAQSMQGRAENETQKPQAIVAPLVEYACPPGGLVLSPFLGSGTDLEVAKLTQRRAVGVDTREQQCEAAAERLSRLLPLQVGA